MRYKTFRGLVVAGFLLSAVGVGIVVLRVLPREAAIYVPARTPRTPPSPVPPLPATAPDTPPAEATTFAPHDASGEGIPLSAMDRAILDRAAQNISGDKVKDAFPGEYYKVNLYRDAGEAKVNRLKIDLDRDDRFDEKWTFLPAGTADQVKRQVSPQDDDTSYTVEYMLRAERWVQTK